jgi:signal transduction histidine kinase
VDARDPIVSPEAPHDSARGGPGADGAETAAGGGTTTAAAAGAADDPSVDDPSVDDPSVDDPAIVAGAPAASGGAARASAAPPARAPRISTPLLAALLGALLVALLLAAAFFAAWQLKRLQIEDWKDRLDNLSLVLAEHTAQSVSSAYLVLDSIVDDINDASIRDAQSLRAQMGTPAINQMLRDRISGSPQIDVATIVADNGDVVNFTRSYPPPPINLADRDYFREQLANAHVGVFISNPVKNRATGTWTFYLSRRLNDPDGRFIGIAIVGLSSSFYTRFYDRIRLGPGASISLLRRDFTLLARAPFNDEAIGRVLAGGSAHRVVDEMGLATGVILTSSQRTAAPSESADRMAAVRLLERYPLMVNIQVTDDVYLDEWRRSVSSMGVIVAGSILALVLAFLALVRVLRRRELEMATNLALKHEAESANRAKSAFLAGMSHELRTPLTAVLGYAELLAKRSPDPFSRECAAQIVSSGGHLLGLLNDLLDLAKVEAGRVDVHPAPVAVAEVVAEAAGLHAASAEQKELSLTTSIAPDVPATIVSDRVLLRQILTNLLNNAIKFTDGGSVALSVGRVEDRVVFAVADTGPGVAPELSEVIFERFRQGDAFLTRRHGGTGLGLALVKDLVGLLGGRVWLESTPGHGATFRFDIPLREPAP